MNKKNVLYSIVHYTLLAALACFGLNSTLSTLFDSEHHCTYSEWTTAEVGTCISEEEQVRFCLSEPSHVQTRRLVNTNAHFYRNGVCVYCNETENSASEVLSPEVLSFTNPIESYNILNSFGFYYDQMSNMYYEHKGIDLGAEVGTPIVSVAKGVIESIYTGDTLWGTQIMIDHGNGLKTVYSFVTTAYSLRVGDTVYKGQMIATVAEAMGEEYQFGSHLHFEMVQNGKNVAPENYLSL